MLTSLEEGQLVEVVRGNVRGVNAPNRLLKKGERATVLAVGPAWDLKGIHVALSVDGEEVTLPVVTAIKILKNAS